MCDQHPIFRAPWNQNLYLEEKCSEFVEKEGKQIQLYCNKFYKYSFLKLIKELIFLFPEKENIKFDVNTIVTIISLLIIHTPTVYIRVLGHSQTYTGKRH